MPRRNDIETILILGSGPIVIGQAAEFDYSGTQALKALRNAGYRLVVVNSNSATIMTDPELSDAVYIEPLTVEFVERIIAAERPDALLPTLGGQTALNLAVGLVEAGVLDRYDVELIGAPLDAIHRAEDRQHFKETMISIGLEVPRSRQVETLRDAVATAEEIGYPLVVRPCFTLGGVGGGIVYNVKELELLVARGLRESPTGTVLVEESVIGWKEFELEVMRDRADNVVIVCSIENLDPMGVHTGDSITVAPAQTLTDREYQRMRDAAQAILRAIGVETGGSNIQFAVCPDTGRLVVIEMNPRVSRSSALASKATGYPIAKVAALLAVGYTLDEIPNAITEQTTAAFEPALDYVVVKVPRFQLEKFPGTPPGLTSQMKSVGEVMAIGRTFKEALGKALRSLELDATPSLDLDRIRTYLATPTPERLSYVYAALRNGVSIDEIHALSHIDRWFLGELEGFVALEKKLVPSEVSDLSADRLRHLKRWGFSDREIGERIGCPERDVRRRRGELGVVPVFKMVDTCAAEFAAATPYYYSTYAGTQSEATAQPDPKVLILGSGPNRIGQGIEFDYANVRAAWALQEAGYRVIMVNSNPETVSTDYDTADRLYFEPLTIEDVLPIVAHEKPIGVITGFGGQTPLKLARRLVEEGVPLLGTQIDKIELAEDRERFAALLQRLGLKAPPYGAAGTPDEALEVAGRLGYPVLVRPSYILGGRAVEIADTPEELRRLMAEAIRISAGHPVFIDRFLEDAIEIDVDVLSDGTDVWVAGLMEQIEEAGIHSGDSACVLPAVSLADGMLDRIELAAVRLVRGLEAIGLVNIQMAVKGRELYIIEANPRASRTVPFVSKTIGIPLAKLAARVLIGDGLREMLAEHCPYPTRHGPCTPEDLRRAGEAGNGLPTPWPAFSSVKEVVLPFGRFPGTDVLRGPEMRSTGEVMSFGRTLPEAFAKAQTAAGDPLPTEGAVLVSLADRDKREGAPLIAQLHDWGFTVVATGNTARMLRGMGIPAEDVAKVGEGRPDVVDRITQGEIRLVINTPSAGLIRDPVPAPVAPTSIEDRALHAPALGERSSGFRMRVAALENHVPYMTNVLTLRAAVAAIRAQRAGSISIQRLGDQTLGERATADAD